MSNYSSPEKAYKYLLFELTADYEEREVKNILSIFFTDLFHINNPQQTEEWESDTAVELCANYGQRLIAKEPIQYITGTTNFFGYEFKVNKHVLIPRAETEELVHQILSDEQMKRQQLDVLDIGTGSGCIAITLKLKRPQWRLFAIEEDLDALNVGRINARRLNTSVHFLKLDFLDDDYWSNLSKYDIIVSNPPYIGKEELDKMSESTINYEPSKALFVEGEDALKFYRFISTFGKSHLKNAGTIFLELNEFRAKEIAEIFELNGYKQVTIHQDMQGKDRMLQARL